MSTSFDPRPGLGCAPLCSSTVPTAAEDQGFKGSEEVRVPLTVIVEVQAFEHSVWCTVKEYNKKSFDIFIKFNGNFIQLGK